MRYGKFLSENGTIGVCAPSVGSVIEPYLSRHFSAVETLEKKGHKIEITESVLKSRKFRSTTGKNRAKEFQKLYFDNNVDVIISEAGGEFMMEILPYINFEKIKKAEPKFFQGSSDNTNLCFTLTTICDVASVYAPCFPDFGMKPWHRVIENDYNFLRGKNEIVRSNDFYEVESIKRQPGHELSMYNCTEPVEWKILSGEKEVEIKGRLIGGCLDILTMLCGTKFDKVKEFVERYKDEKIIWYLESCDLNLPSQTRAIWQLKNAGWFKNVAGFIIGRPLNSEKMFGSDYKQANYMHLKDFNVPVVIDADFGHLPPSVHMINGAVATIKVKDGKGEIKYDLI